MQGIGSVLPESVSPRGMPPPEIRVERVDRLLPLERLLVEGDYRGLADRSRVIYRSARPVGLCDGAEPMKRGSGQETDDGLLQLGPLDLTIEDGIGSCDLTAALMLAAR